MGIDHKRTQLLPKINPQSQGQQAIQENFSSALILAHRLSSTLDLLSAPTIAHNQQRAACSLLCSCCAPAFSAN